MSREGRSVQEIATELDLPKYLVSAALYRGRVKGEIPERKINFTNNYLFRKFGIRAGHITRLLEQLTPDQRVWLFSETTKIGCTTIAEYLLERIRDDYEEHDQRQRRGEKARASDQ